MKNENRLTMYIDYNHLVAFEPMELCEVVTQEYHRYTSNFNKAVFDFMF